jgi:hypothetical protein
VLQAFVEHYPRTRRLDVLQQEVSRAAGGPVSQASVKRALQEGRRKLREALAGRGYAPAWRGEPAR